MPEPMRGVRRGGLSGGLREPGDHVGEPGDDGRGLIVMAGK